MVEVKAHKFDEDEDKDKDGGENHIINNGKEIRHEPRRACN